MKWLLLYGLRVRHISNKLTKMQRILRSGNSVVIYVWEAGVWRNELMGVKWNWCLYLS